MGAPALLRGHQFGDADQVIGDQIEQEVGGDASDATMFGLKRFPADLNRRDSQRVKDERVFVHRFSFAGAGDAEVLFW